MSLDHRAGILPLALAALLPFTPARSQTAPSRGALIVRLGQDTVSVERFTRGADRMEGEILLRPGGTSLIRYRADLDPNGRVTGFTFRRHRIEGDQAVFDGTEGRLVLERDSATVEIRRDTVTRRRRMAAREGVPLLPDAFALYELWLPRAVRARDSMAVIVVSPLGGPAGRLSVRVFGTDSVHVGLMNQPIRVRTNPAGHLLALDGGSTLVKYQAERVADVPLMALAARYAALDRAGRGLGVWLSPRDTTRATVAGASLWVDYGRPSRRGRDIFGTAILGDTLWRTGANAATQFRTDRDLVIGERRLPAGTYTLWTHASPAGYELIINGQTGQWGTQYDPARDVMRVPLAVRGLAEPVELLTIAIEDRGGGRGELVLSWDRRALAIGFALAASPSGAIEARLQRLADSILAARPKVPGLIIAVEDTRQGRRWAVASGFSDTARRVALRPDQPVRIASNTKTYTAAAILRLMEEGRLALADPIANHLPAEFIAALERDGYRTAQITIEHLLSHRGGLAEHPSVPSFVPTVLAEPQKRWTRAEQVRWMVDSLDPIGAPGAQFRYSDTGYILLGAIIERHTGANLGVGVRGLLGFGRLGLRQTWFETLEPAPQAPDRAHQYMNGTDSHRHDPSFDLYGGGGIVATVEDLGGFLTAVFQGRVFRHRTTLDTMIAARSQEFGGYGLGIFGRVVDAKRGFGHSGFWGTAAFHFPEQGITVAAAVNEQSQGGAVFGVMAAAVRAMAGDGPAP